jgi:hypothetical protein
VSERIKRNKQELLTSSIYFHLREKLLIKLRLISSIYKEFDLFSDVDIDRNTYQIDFFVIYFNLFISYPYSFFDLNLVLLLRFLFINIKFCTSKNFSLFFFYQIFKYISFTLIINLYPLERISPLK